MRSTKVANENNPDSEIEVKEEEEKQEPKEDPTINEKEAKEQLAQVLEEIIEPTPRQTLADQDHSLKEQNEPEARETI